MIDPVTPKLDCTILDVERLAAIIAPFPKETEIVIRTKDGTQHVPLAELEVYLDEEYGLVFDFSKVMEFDMEALFPSSGN